MIACLVVLVVLALLSSLAAAPSSSDVLVVVGSRRWRDYPRLCAVCGSLRALRPVGAVWSGGARGADTLGVRWARGCGLPVRIWSADWSLGRSAGVRRTVAMLDAVPADSALVAFVPGRLSRSRGTLHTVRLALARGLVVYLVEGSRPARLLGGQLGFRFISSQEVRP